jgi:hypothetical protein
MIPSNFMRSLPGDGTAGRPILDALASNLHVIRNRLDLIEQLLCISNRLAPFVRAPPAGCDVRHRFASFFEWVGSAFG